MRNTIHYAFILDQSGSMLSLKHEVVSSYNEQVETIKKLKKSNPNSKIKFTLCTFNDEIKFKFIAQSFEKLKKIKPNDYQPNSCTALYDAMGLTLSKIRELKDTDDKVFIAIFTDGLENASTDYTTGDIRIKLAQADKNGWQISFFCQKENNIFYKRNLGINDRHILNITLNEAGLKTMENEIFYRIKSIADNQKTQK